MSHVLSAVAWPYANGPRHLGHVAGFGVPSDVFSRYLRMAGHEVLMVSGSDEHGTPILVQADKAGQSPQEFIDANHALIAQDLADLGVSYDLYTRTTTANHDDVVQQMFLACHANGYMVEQTQQVAISPSTGRTLPDRYISATTAATSSTRPISRTRAPRSTARRRSSATPSTSSSTCRRSPRRWASGWPVGRRAGCGGPTSSASPATSSRRSARAR